jgi:glycosyltransferase involved in cell wall biosynthesis
MPKVSVIIPTHNRAEYLRSAITSVLNQTYQDFEIIVVDDASKDNTQQVVASFDEPRIKYIRHETGKGDGGARNTGIINSTGDYIGFLDDDDQWLSEKLDFQVAVLENSPQHMGGVYTGHFDINGADGEIINVSYPNRRGDLSQYALIESCIITSCVLLRRECFSKVGLFDERIPYCNDRDMWIRIAKEFHFEYIRQPLVKYLIHKDKLSTNFKLVIKGREMILQKYSEDFNSHRKAYAERYLTLGELYCYDGNVKKGREAFLKSIKIYPFEIRSYCQYCLSFLGPKNFKTSKETVQQLLAPARERKLHSELRKLASQTSETKGIIRNS